MSPFPIHLLIVMQRRGGKQLHRPRYVSAMLLLHGYQAELCFQSLRDFQGQLESRQDGGG